MWDFDFIYIELLKDKVFFNYIEMATIYTYEILKTIIDYTHCSHTNLCKVLRKFGSNGECEFSKWNPIQEHNNENHLCKDKLKCPLLTNFHRNTGNFKKHYHCACTEPIIYPFLVRNTDNFNLLIIGSKCIHRFGEKATEDLKNIIYANSGKTRCNECKGTVSKPIVDRYSHEENIYHLKCYTGQNHKIQQDTPLVNILPVIITKEKIQETELLPPPYEPIIETITKDTIITFKPYNGQPFSKLLEDINFCKWIRKQENPKGKQFKEVHNYLINRFI